MPEVELPDELVRELYLGQPDSFIDRRKALVGQLRSAGRREEAAKEYRLALEDRPDYRLAHYHLARILANQGNYAEAVTHLLETLAPEDDFFKKLGIDSLQTLEMLSRLENHFGIELPDYEVQGVSNFKTLAERIQSRL